MFAVLPWDSRIYWLLSLNRPLTQRHTQKGLKFFTSASGKKDLNWIDSDNRIYSSIFRKTIKSRIFLTDMILTGIIGLVFKIWDTYLKRGKAEKVVKIRTKYFFLAEDSIQASNKFQKVGF